MPTSLFQCYIHFILFKKTHRRRPRQSTRLFCNIVHLNWTFWWSRTILNDNLEDSFVFADLILQVQLIVSGVGSLGGREEDACLTQFDVHNQFRSQRSFSLNLPVDLRLRCSDKVNVQVECIAGTDFIPAVGSQNLGFKEAGNGFLWN